MSSIDQNEGHESVRDCDDDTAEQTADSNVSEKPTVPVDKYSYTNLCEFTSENFKIEVQNLPRYYGLGQFKKLLNNRLQLAPHKLKPVPGRGGTPGVLFVTFRDEEARQRALSALNGFQWKKSRLSVRPAAAAADPYVVSRAKRVAAPSTDVDASSTDDQPPPEKKSRLTTELDAAHAEQLLRQAVVPWADVPYDEQLQRKAASVQNAVDEYARRLRRLNYAAFRHLGDAGGGGVRVLPIRASPATDKYRNKCEFTVGVHPTSGERTVGFRLAAYKTGSVSVVSPRRLPHVADCMQRAVAAFERHVRASPLPPYDPCSHSGHWRQLMVRCTRLGHLMLVVDFDRQTLTDEQVAEEQRTLSGHMLNAQSHPDKDVDCVDHGDICDDVSCGVTGPFDITSLYWQTLIRGRPAELKLVFGSECVQERVCGLHVRVSPQAFLQVNTSAAELLYQAIGEFVNWPCLGQERLQRERKSITLLDVCCGTGTIGLAVAAAAGLRRSITTDHSGGSSSGDGDGECGLSKATSSITTSTKAVSPVLDEQQVEVEPTVQDDQHEVRAAGNELEVIQPIATSADDKSHKVSSGVARVIGIELVASAISDASRNAQLNALGQCCQFFAGRAEKLLPVLLQHGGLTRLRSDGGDNDKEEDSDDSVVAVVDPPRAGLGRQVALALRRCARVRRVVFVACDVRQSLDNLLDLGRPSSRRSGDCGAAFVVRAAAAVDLFPHTPHVEVAFLLERCEEHATEATVATAAPSGGDCGSHTDEQTNDMDTAAVGKAGPVTKQSETGQLDVGDGCDQAERSGDVAVVSASVIDKTGNIQETSDAGSNDAGVGGSGNDSNALVS